MKKKWGFAACLIIAIWAVALQSWRLEPEAGTAEAAVALQEEQEPVLWEPVEVIELIQEEPEQAYTAYDDVPLPEDLQIFMQEKCEQLDLSYEFALALMETESSFIEDAVGDGGRSIGYMQINRCNWERMQDDYGLDVNVAEDNVAAGLVILRELFDINDDPYYVILCYKAGTGRGAELYEQKKFVGETYDCIAICERATAWEKAHGK